MGEINIRFAAVLIFSRGSESPGEEYVLHKERFINLRKKKNLTTCSEKVEGKLWGSKRTPINRLTTYVLAKFFIAVILL